MLLVQTTPPSLAQRHGWQRYFVTWRLARGPPRLSQDERALVCSVLRHRDGPRYLLLAFAVMDDHVHVLVCAMAVTLDQVVHSWKSFPAHQLQRHHARIGQVWQDESFDRVIRSGGELHEKADYSAGDPWTRWPEIEKYEWAWVMGDRQ